MARALVVFASVVLLGSCTSVPATQLLVVVDSDYAPSTELEAVRIEVFGEGDVPLAERELTLGTPAEPGLPPVTLPLSVGATLASLEEGDSVRVRAQGIGPGAVDLAAASAEATAASNAAVIVPLFLARSCEEITCGVGRSCDGGACVASPRFTEGVERPSATLSSFLAPGRALSPRFVPSTFEYEVGVAADTSSVELVAEPVDPGATLTANGRVVIPGVPFAVPIEPGANEVAIEVLGPEGDLSIYSLIVHRGPYRARTYLKPTFADAPQLHGFAVSVDGDLAAAGAFFNSTNAPGIDAEPIPGSSVRSSGAVVVYRREGPGWVVDSTIKHPSPDINDAFGASLALDGDTLVVGSLNEASTSPGIDGDMNDNGAPGAGAVYVYRREGESFALEAFIKAPVPDAGDSFGARLALVGDVLAVSAFNEDGSGTGTTGDPSDDAAVESGAVFVYERSGTTWQLAAYLKPPVTSPNAIFGTGIATDGTRIVVGAPGESSGGRGIDPAPTIEALEESGAAYVFVREPGGWALEHTIKASNAGAGDGFGFACAIDGEWMLISAFQESSGDPDDPDDDGAFGSGAAYAYRFDVGGLREVAYIKAPNIGVDDLFGSQVAIEGDLVVISAFQEDGEGRGVDPPFGDAAEDAGAAYAFRRQGEAFVFDAYLKATNTDRGDNFGVGVDVDGETIIVGAWTESSAALGVNGNQEDNSATSAGAAYLIE